MDRKTGKTWLLMMLLVGSLAFMIAAGRTNTAVHASSSVSASSVLPPKDWSQTYGGSGDDYAYSLVQTGDGGYVLAGFTDSSGAGGFDFYLVKTDVAGTSSPGSGFNLSSIEGYLVLGGITILIIGIAFFIVSRRRK